MMCVRCTVGALEGGLTDQRRSGGPCCLPAEGGGGHLTGFSLPVCTDGQTCCYKYMHAKTSTFTENAHPEMHTQTLGRLYTDVQ